PLRRYWSRVILVHGIVLSLESSQIRGNHSRPKSLTSFSVRLSGGVKQLRRGASIPKPPDAQPKLPAVAFAVQILPGQLVCGFVRVSGSNEPRVFLIIAATAPRIDFVYVHPCHDEGFR